MSKCTNLLTKTMVHTRLLIIYGNLEHSTIDALKKFTNKETIQDVVALSDGETVVSRIEDFVQAGMEFQSIGIIAHGHNLSTWSSTIMNKDFANGIKNILIASEGTIDIFACNMKSNEACLNMFAAHLGTIPVFYSIDITGTSNRNGNWIMERKIEGTQDCDATGTDRNLAELYLSTDIDLSQSVYFNSTDH